MANLQIRTIRQAVLIVSLISSVIDTILVILHGTPWWTWIATFIGNFVVTYFITNFFLRKYIIYRIKPLYQLLLSRDIRTSRLSEGLRKKASDDLVKDIHDNIGQLEPFSDSEFERLRQKEKERSEFLAAVCHEIRTPIFNIQGYTHTLLDGGLDDPEVNRRFLERTIRSVDMISEMVSDIDKLIDYESGGMVMHKDEFDIVEAVNEVVDVNVITLADRGIRVVTDRGTFPSSGPVMVFADEIRIKQIIDKLMRNAIKYSPDNGTITVSLIDMFDKTLIEVTDHGVGIASKDIPHLFEPLYRVDKSRSRHNGGVGLGLPLVKSILDAHGENITVRSKPGVGSTFSFTLSKPPHSDGAN